MLCYNLSCKRGYRVDYHAVFDDNECVQNIAKHTPINLDKNAMQDHLFAFTKLWLHLSVFVTATARGFSKCARTIDKALSRV